MVPSLLKFLLDVSSEAEVQPPLRETLMGEAAVCLQLMDHCCHGNLQVSSPATAASPVGASACQCLCPPVSVHLSFSV